MNHHPVHLNADYAEKKQHGKILVVGTLVFSVVVGITVPDISGKAIANLEYESIQHLGPVYLNDTIYVHTTIIDKWETSKIDRGIVHVETIAKNQHGEDVLSFKRKVLVLKKRVSMNDMLLRSLMFVPSHNEKLMKSASKSNADVLLLDVEDSVQPNANKQLARDTILKYLKEGLLTRKQYFRGLMI